MNNIDYLKKYYQGDMKEALKKLEQGIPVQYIVGNVDFLGYTINVNENVLIPRFETELLVTKTIEYIKKQFNEKVKILEIGTGSGCISISLLKELNCNIDASDISDEALNQAKINSENNNTNINFIKSDVFDNINNKYDIIISNPPYIAHTDEIMDIILKEPLNALYADDDGLYFYKKILKEAKVYLNDKFIIALEIGSNQGNRVKEVAKTYFKEANIKIEKDLQDKDRFIFIIKN